MKRTTNLWKMTVSALMVLVLTLTGCGKNTDVTSSDTVQWFNNTYAVLTVLNQRDYRVYSGSRPGISDKIIAKALLENIWNVTDRESADEMLLWLLEEGHRVPFADADPCRNRSDYL